MDDIFDSVKMFETPYLYKPKKVAVQNKVKTLQKLIKRSDVVMVATFRKPLKASTHFQNFKKAVSILSQESDTTVKAVAVTSKETAAAGDEDARGGRLYRREAGGEVQIQGDGPYGIVRHDGQVLPGQVHELVC